MANKIFKGLLLIATHSLLHRSVRKPGSSAALPVRDLDCVGTADRSRDHHHPRDQDYVSLEPPYQSGICPQAAAESTTNKKMGLTTMRSVRAAAPCQPTSRHITFPTPLNRTVLPKRSSVRTVKHASLLSH